VGYSVSVTTRAPRAGEVDGVEYHFWTDQDFHAAHERGDFAESASVHGHHYGTLKREIEGVLSEGRIVVLDIDVQGAQQLVLALPHAVSVFVLPPSAAVLAARLGARNSENSSSFRLRLKNAAAELHEVDNYDYVLVNENLDTAVATVSAIVDAELHRRDRAADLGAVVRELQDDLEHQLATLEQATNQ
jgi:guanylate kinase